MKNSVRTNTNLRDYLQWLRGKLSGYLHKDEERKRLRSLNVTLTEKLYLEKTGRVEHVFITGNDELPIVKIIGGCRVIKYISDERLTDFISLVLQDDEDDETEYQIVSSLRNSDDEDR